MKLKLIPKVNLGKFLPLPKFPHFKRKFNATPLILVLKYSLWTFIYVCVLTNLLTSQLFEADEEKSLRLSILKNPKQASLHEKLGQYYLSRNKKEAQKEYELAQNYYTLLEPQTNNVLGAQISPREKWSKITSKREKLEQEEKYWQSVQQKLPDYIYATLKFTTLNYQLGNKEKAKEYLESALKQDPGNQMVLEITERLK